MLIFLGAVPLVSRLFFAEGLKYRMQLGVHALKNIYK